MISKNILNLRVRSILKKNKQSRNSTPYPQVTSIGILYTTEDKGKHDLIKETLKVLVENGIKAEVLTLLPKNKENFEFKFDFFVEKEISVLGTIRSTAITTFISKPFDYLICLDLRPTPKLKLLLALSKAKCRVGKFGFGYEPFFELMVDSKPETNVRQLRDDILRYIKALH
jgi:hypothetical protein